MANYHSEQFLLRKKKVSTDWKAIGLMFLGAILGSLAFFVLLMEYGAAHAHAEESYSAIIKDGEIITKESFCHG